MRDYTRKAKRIDNGEWVKGFYFCMEHKDGRHVHHFIIPLGADLSLGTPIEKIQVEIDPTTICDPTGLTDKNRNKIWEHDIVHLFGKDTIRNYDWKAVVEFGNPNSLYSWGYQLKPIGHFEYNENILCWVGMEEANIYCEVIGNIFDNADLLKGE